VHRSIGTHISKVKSTNLDTWTNEQIDVRGHAIAARRTRPH
jgi:hypothetical protein